MNNIPGELKMQLFGKQENEPLDAEEQKSFENYLMQIPVTGKGLTGEIVTQLNHKKNIAWEKFVKRVFRINRH